MRFMKEVLKKNRIWVVLYLAIGIVNSFLTNYKAEYFQKVIDGLNTRTILLSGILIYGAIIITNYLLEYIDEYPAKKLEHGIYLDFKILAIEKISRIDYLRYQSYGTGMMIQKIENGADAGKSVLYDFWLCVIRQLVPTVLFSVYFIFRINKKVTVLLLCGYFIIFIITNLLLKYLYQIKERILDNEERLNHFLVRGFMEMLVFRMERQFSKEIQKASDAKNQIVSAKIKMNMIHEAFFTVFALLIAFLDIGILIFAWKTQNISVGSAVALLALIENAYTPIAIFNVLYVQYKLDLTAFHRFEELLDEKEDEQLTTGEVMDRFSGFVEVKDLSFGYTDRDILNHVSLSIKPGEKIAFVGESGSGKSTLIKNIVGLLKYNSGEILLDGKDLKNLCLDDYYKNISYLSQDAPVFAGTIRENLVFDRDISDEELKNVLRKVKLKELISNLEEGLNTSVGERGVSLSGGERQRLALARLFFKDTSMIILDEATSAMDAITEEEVLSNLFAEFKDQTVLAITHGFNSINAYDKIVVFRDGKIVETGSFEELMRNNTYFSELYNKNIE